MNSIAFGVVVGFTLVNVVGVPPTVTVALDRPLRVSVPTPGLGLFTVTVQVPAAPRIGHVVLGGAGDRASAAPGEVHQTSRERLEDTGRDRELGGDGERVRRAGEVRRAR